MSEKILRALMQLFALITKQDAGVEENEKRYVRNFLSQQIAENRVEEYYQLFLEHAGPDQRDQTDSQKLTSVLDSVKILGICRKINKSLNQSQKVVVLVRLYELVSAHRKFTRQRMAIIDTVADVFRIPKKETASIESFFHIKDCQTSSCPDILIINDRKEQPDTAKHIHTEKLDQEIFILKTPSVDLLFLRYDGRQDVFLNGLAINRERVYLLAGGSTIRLPKGKPVYYSDIAAKFMADMTIRKITFQVENIEYKFSKEKTGLRNISFAETHGKLAGIMGASGTGKTTLLNVLSGLEKPSAGRVLINSIDLHQDPGELKGVIGLIPQDDLLIEELTVFENLYFNARLCFGDKNSNEVRQMVNNTLNNLGIFDLKDIKVGSPFKKIISGGQRKRLNIALELIREPSILFVDEPTSGLSSRDSENVMDLLRELVLKGKLVFAVIHQPSSGIFKMFDNVIILDEGGYLIYHGNPIEAVMYFKELDAQINSEIGECPVCGNVNPEMIFNIVEARVVDEFGNYTEERKVNPGKWQDQYHERVSTGETEPAGEPPPRNLQVPKWISQLKIFSLRDFLSKISNRQYVVLNLLEAPVLAFILSYIIRYIADPGSDTYIFRQNENIPIYIFMSLIVAVFLGLTVSAEEIFRDRKILKRESFLNLSRSGYLLSKILILFFLSAIQAFLFVMIGNSILEIRGMMFHYWFALFTTAACANLIGLNVSSSFNSPITIYIIIPLLMIPMMILSGAMFSFDKLNRKVSSIDKVPWIAELMPTKWSYEALMVHQYKNNDFEKVFFSLEKQESKADFKNIYLIPELREKIDLLEYKMNSKGEIGEDNQELVLLRNEIGREMDNVPQIPFEAYDELHPERFSGKTANKLNRYLDELGQYYNHRFLVANRKIENSVRYLMKKDPELYRYIKDAYHNESVADHVRKIYEKNKIIEYNGRLIQQIDPVYKDPRPKGSLDFRAHLFAPQKHFLGFYFRTYWFNMAFIWFLTMLLYIALYYDFLKKPMNIPGKNRFIK